MNNRTEAKAALREACARARKAIATLEALLDYDLSPDLEMDESLRKSAQDIIGVLDAVTEIVPDVEAG